MRQQARQSRSGSQAGSQAPGNETSSGLSGQTAAPTGCDSSECQQPCSGQEEAMSGDRVRTGWSRVCVHLPLDSRTGLGKPPCGTCRNHFLCAGSVLLISEVHGSESLAECFSSGLALHLISPIMCDFGSSALRFPRAPGCLLYLLFFDGSFNWGMFLKDFSWRCAF